MKKTFLFAVIAAALPLAASAEIDCLKLSLSIKAAVASQPAKVLEVVAKEVAANPTCACEVVKAAIEGSSAEPKTVAAIVEAAVTAAPEHIRLIAQCAVAAAPDALAEVQAVLAKFDPNSGESVTSAKDAKAPAGEVAAMPNPLDFPGEGPVGPLSGPGGPGGSSLLPSNANFVPIINPPQVTEVNP